MLRINVSANIPLHEPDADEGLITWFSVGVYYGEDENEEERIGEATVALVHVGEAANAGQDLLDALDADSAELEALYHTYFQDDWIKDRFMDGSGSDLLYVADIEIAAAYDGRNIDLAVVRRLCNTIGHGCGLAVIPYDSKAEIAHWSRMGFAVSTPGKPTGWLHMTMGDRKARIAGPEDDGRFKIVPNLTETKRQQHH
jgi:hypothetical protein